MNHELTSSGSVLIQTNAARVWDVLTKPEMIKEYLFGTNTTTDWQVGSNILFEGDYQGTKYQDKGVVRENIPYRKISYSYWSAFFGTEDKPENYSLVTYDVEPAGDAQTQLTWTMKGFTTEEGQQHSQNGMEAFLNKIKEIAERQ